MPVYLVTDTLAGHKVMVEAERPAGAITALVNNRFDVSQGLAAGDALRLMGEGISFINAESPSVIEEGHAQPPQGAQADMSAEVSADLGAGPSGWNLSADRPSPLEEGPDADGPEFAEVDEAPTRPSLSEILGSEAEDDDASDLAYLK